jgi:hypothetical protein
MAKDKARDVIAKSIKDISENMSALAFEKNGMDGIFHHPYMKASVLMEIACEIFIQYSKWEEEQEQNQTEQDARWEMFQEHMRRQRG